MKKEIDAIIVLGIDKGRIEAFNSRLAKGIELSKKYPNAKLIFSGGYSFRLPEDPKYREALLMKKQALEEKILEEKILTETNSRDTFGNAYFTRTDIIDKHNWKKLIVVPSPTNLNKVQYYFNLVFGKNYAIEYIPSENISSKEKIEEYASVTTKNLEKEKTLTGNIIPGNIKSIKKFLFSKHPAYSENTKTWSENTAKYDKND